MFRLLLALLVGVVAASAACGGARHVDSKAGEEYLADIRIEGNHAISARDLLPGLALRRAAEAGRPVDPFILANDVTRVRGAYVRLGYFEVDVHARLDHKGEATTVVFVVKEGARAKTQVQLVGLPTNDPKVSSETLRKLVPLAEGASFDYDTYDDAKKTLLDAVQDAGYAHAQLGATVIADRANGNAIARYLFDPGPPCTFGAIEVAGAPGDLEDAVRARLAFKTGDVYSAAKIAQTQRALYELGRFSTVRVDPAPDLAATAIAVKIYVAIGTRHEERLGGGVAYEPLTWDLRGRLGYSVAGCLDALTTCSFDFQPGVTFNHPDGLAPDFTTPEPKIRLLAGLHRLDFLRPFITGDAEIGVDYLTIEAYTYTGPRARLGLTTPLAGKWLLARVGWAFAYYWFLNVDTIVDTGTRELIGLEDHSGNDLEERLGVYQESIVIDLRDSQVAPTRGLYFEGRLAEGTKLAGGAYDYIQAIPELRLYAPLGKFVLAGRARAGGFVGDVPPTERFYGGGASSQRGFNERGLSPTLSGFVPGDSSFHSVPIGGAWLAETSVELRTPPASIFGVDLAFVAFLDGGDVTNTLAAMNLDNLHWATGGGLRIPTPIGAIRLDLGYRLNRLGPEFEAPEPTGLLRPFAIHFGIGEAF